MFRESQSRVHSIALIHERLCQSNDLARIDVAEYVQSLTTHLVHSFGVDSNRVRLTTEITDRRLGIDLAVPCALLINELVSNALRHAFPGQRRGEIHVILRENGDDRLVLTVRDDGVGLPAGIDLKSAHSLGLELVATLAQQLEGTIEVSRTGGTSFRITFAAERESGRPVPVSHGIS
jgi:two-component sensor histidine kinase